ncbi:hypothetical protein [Saccharothrix sp. Mg75]|uniref:hypothetical protein n=1 Tax=Saccharothrix sp. Mg75 TaxID=3445357 RepID=UPI003EEBC08A
MNTSPDPSSGDDTRVTPDRGPRSHTPPRVPRWVKVSTIIVGILVLLVVVAQLTGLASDHGPGRHMRSSSRSRS